MKTEEIGRVQKKIASKTTWFHRGYVGSELTYITSRLSGLGSFIIEHNFELAEAIPVAQLLAGR